ncbi:hypothetical protein EMCRGX_G018653 [Ephydatia muelleri]
MAERLHAEVGNNDTVYLLATCYYRSGRKQQAKYLLEKHSGNHSAKCNLLYARCCLDLGELQKGLLRLNGLLSPPHLHRGRGRCGVRARCGTGVLATGRNEQTASAHKGSSCTLEEVP